MASWTNPTILGTGAVLPSTAYNAVANNTAFLYQAPYVKAVNSSSVSLLSGVFTQISLVNAFSGYGFSVSSNNLIIPVTGIYSIDYLVGIAPSATVGPFMISAVEQNGSQISTAWGTMNQTQNSIGSSVIASCTAGDTISLLGQQNSGSTLGTENSGFNTYVTAFFVGSV